MKTAIGVIGLTITPLLIIPVGSAWLHGKLPGLYILDRAAILGLGLVICYIFVDSLRG